MKSHIMQFAGVLAASLLLVGDAAAGDGTSGREVQSYNLTHDWSNTSNPNGVWSYNQNTTPISQFQTFWWGGAGWGYFWFGDGCIMKAGDYPAGTTDPWGNLVAPAHDWKAGDVVMHALSLPYGGDTTFVNVTWTSPGDGKIDLSGRAWDAEIFADRDVSWSLLVGSNTVAQCVSVRGIFRKDKVARFNANRIGKRPLSGIPVTQGEVVEFKVAATTYYGHFVGVEEQIIFTPKRK